jgi:protein-disulfide isomerase
MPMTANDPSDIDRSRARRNFVSSNNILHISRGRTACDGCRFRRWIRACRPWESQGSGGVIMTSGFRCMRSAIAFVLVMVFPWSLLAQAGKDTDPNIVAKIQKVQITRDELLKYAAADLERLDLERMQFEANQERDRHQVMEANLARLLEDKLLGLEAEKRGVSRDQLLQMELQSKVGEPTEADVKAYYEANKQRITQPYVQIASQIYKYLKSENYNRAKANFVDQLKQSHGAATFLEPLRARVEIAGSPSQGPVDAPVTLVEFSDFQCPYCAVEFNTLRQVMSKYGSQVRLVYRNFPLFQIHPNAQKAAEAGLCAADQGHFWEMHDLMFQSQSQLDEVALKAKAAQLKLDPEAFNTCLATAQHADRVRKDLNAGAMLGVSGTPALFINGRFVSGAVPFAQIARIIDEELKTSAQTGARDK